ncbi:hypothetical protein KI387_000452 [Taxus chinensis]|uniref:F-box domain-containing protein n=1 Tax=Taxus chinensis TaxID=29808 RepID=A0AA38GRT7_TAXCH|nr:hypothetical protein KI387_000452 [Taxus chinensis]
MGDALVIAREMTMAFEDGGGMLLYFPYDLLLNILAKLPIRYLVRMKAVCKRWNQMLSSPDAFKLIYRNMPLVRTPAFFIHSPERSVESELFLSWVIEPMTGEFYRVPTPEFPRLLNRDYCIVDACNGIYCLSHHDTNFSGGLAFTMCNPGTNTFKRLPDNGIIYWNFSGLAFDPSTAHFTLLLGLDEYLTSSPDSSEEEDESDPDYCFIEIYDSHCNAWTPITSTKPVGIKKIQGRGIYSGGSFYWLLENQSNNKGMIIRFLIGEKLWTRILGPYSAYSSDFDLLIRRSAFDYEETNDHEEISPSYFNRVKHNLVSWEGELAFRICAIDDTLFPEHAWWLTGTDGRLVLVNKDICCMWELKEDLLEWCQVHITLPNPLYGVAVNISGWTLASGEHKLMIYNGERIFERTIDHSELHLPYPPEPRNCSFSADHIWPFEWNNVVWP